MVEFSKMDLKDYALLYAAAVAAPGLVVLGVIGGLTGCGSDGVVRNPKGEGEGAAEGEGEGEGEISINSSVSSFSVRITPEFVARQGDKIVGINGNSLFRCTTAGVCDAQTEIPPFLDGEGNRRSYEGTNLHSLASGGTFMAAQGVDLEGFVFEDRAQVAQAFTAISSSTGGFLTDFDSGLEVGSGIAVTSLADHDRGFLTFFPNGIAQTSSDQLFATDVPGTPSSMALSGDMVMIRSGEKLYKISTADLTSPTGGVTEAFDLAGRQIVDGRLLSMAGGKVGILLGDGLYSFTASTAPEKMIEGTFKSADSDDVNTCALTGENKVVCKTSDDVTLDCDVQIEGAQKLVVIGSRVAVVADEGPLNSKVSVFEIAEGCVQK